MSEQKDAEVILIHPKREEITALAFLAVNLHVRYDIDSDGDLLILDPTGRAVTMVQAAANRQGITITREIAASYVTAEIQRRIRIYHGKVRTTCDNHLPHLQNEGV